MHRPPLSWAVGPWLPQRIERTVLFSPSPCSNTTTEDTQDTNWTNSLGWLNCKKSWRNREVKYCLMSSSANFVRPADGKKGGKLLTLSTKANPMMEKRLLPMPAGVSPEDIQGNKGEHGGWRSESHDVTGDSNTSH